MKLPEFGVKRPVATLMIFAALAVLSAVSIEHLSIDLFPEIEPPAISVITAYPGASAKDVEAKVTRHIENELSIVSNLDEIRSTSKENLSIVTAKFNWETNLAEAANDIRDRLEFAKGNLPDAAEDPVIFKFNTSMFPVLIYGVSADEHSENLFQIVDRQIVSPLKRVGGVGSVSIIGGLERQINVVLDREKMEAFDVSPEMIELVLASENVTLPAGSIKVGRSEYALRVPGEFQSPREIEDVVLKRLGNRIVYLGDVADVDDSFKEETMRVRADGRQALVFYIQKQSGANTVDVAAAARERLQSIERMLPGDIEVTLLESQSEFIERSISNLRNTAIWGAVLVMLVTFVFLREPRSSFIIAVTIPVAALSALLFMRLLGYTINIMSLFALAIAAGMVVDNAVVVLENITRFRESGRRADEAARFGASEVAQAVGASTLTTVVIFVPLLFLSGITGILFKQLGVVISIALVTSLFTALTLTPMMASRLLKRQIYIPATATGRKFFAATEKALVWVEDMYYRVIAAALANRGRVILVAVLSLAMAAVAATRIGSEFFPEEDTGNIRVTVELPVETRVEETDRLAVRLEDLFKSVMRDELEHVFTRTGTSVEGFASAMGGREGSNIIESTAKLVPVRARRRSASQLANIISTQVRKLPGVVKVTVDAANPMTQMLVASERAIAVEIMGHDLKTTDALADEIKAMVESVPGAVDVTVSRSPGKPELLVEIDRQKAATLGINVAALGSTLRTYFYGKAVTEFREGGEEYDIYLRLPEAQRSRMSDIRSITVKNVSGEAIPLPNFARINESTGPAEIERLNQARLVTVSAGVYGRSQGEVTADIEKHLQRLAVPRDTEIRFAGLVKEERESRRSLLIMLLVGVALVYMVMASQFESLVHPFIIMFSVPFAFVGVAFALYFTGHTLNVITFIGIVMLVGIVVNNAIVLVDHINLLKKRGAKLEEALKNACTRRLRPVLITTVTTLAGLLPLAVATGEGHEVMRPLGATVMGGLLFSTLVTLVLVPVIYSLVEGTREKAPATSGPAVLAAPVAAPSRFKDMPLARRKEEPTDGDVS